MLPCVITNLCGFCNMRVECPECFRPAVVSSRKRMSEQVTNLYCSCSDPECGASFVSSLSFSHILSPSRKQSQNVIAEWLAKLSPADRATLLKQASFDLD